MFRKTFVSATFAVTTILFMCLLANAQPQSKPKPSPTQPNPQSEAFGTGRQVITGKIAEVNNQARTFIVQVTFSAAKLSKLPTVREVIEITYTETPGGGPMEATTVNSSKSNSSERAPADTASSKLLTGQVTEVNDRAKTFIVQVTFSAAKLSKLPTVGQVVDITYIEPPDGGGPLEASNLNLSKSNIN